MSDEETDNQEETAATAATDEGAAIDEGSETSVLPPAEVRAVLEALIFASEQPITPREIGQVLGGVPKEMW